MRVPAEGVSCYQRSFTRVGSEAETTVPNEGKTKKRFGQEGSLSWYIYEFLACLAVALAEVYWIYPVQGRHWYLAALLTAIFYLVR